MSATHKNILVFLTVVLLLLAGFPLRAQWSGSLNLKGGLGWTVDDTLEEDKKDILPHGLAQGDFKLQYKKGIFDWSSTLDGKWETKTTAESRYSYKSETLTILEKGVRTRPVDVGLRTQFSWTPNPIRRYSFWVQYRYKNDQSNNNTLNVALKENKDSQASLYLEEATLNEHKWGTGGDFRHTFSSNTVLLGSLTATGSANQRCNMWITSKAAGDIFDEGGEAKYDYQEKIYRITPSTNNLDFSGNVHVQIKLREGDPYKLTIDPGIRFKGNNSFDHNSGATASIRDGNVDVSKVEWRDSVSLRENFYFFTTQVEPFMVADFSWKNLSAHADYAIQVYGRTLNSDEHKQTGVGLVRPYPVGSGNVSWKFSPRHKLTLTNKLSVSHPDYLKVCWYDRTGGYLDQLFRGNEKLYSTQTFDFSLAYEFRYKRFLASLTTSTFRRINEIDQTWSNEEIEGRMYKVFTWLNSADSDNFGLLGRLGWEGKVITAHAAVQYKNTRRVARADGAVKSTFDWQVTGDVSARLGKGWTIGSDFKYQSNVATFFTIFKQYCVVNARVRKDFEKWAIYLEGRDLLDNPRETSFQSTDGMELWVNLQRSNRRVILLGFNWKF